MEKRKVVDKRNKAPRIVFIGTSEECKKFRTKNYPVKEHPLVVITAAEEGDEALPILPKEEQTAANYNKEARTFEDASKVSKAEHKHGKKEVGASLETSTKFDKETKVEETPVVETPVVETPVVETPSVEETSVEEPVQENLENTEKLVESLKEQGKLQELVNIKHKFVVEVDGNNVAGVEVKINSDGSERSLVLNAGEFKAALKIIEFLAGL